MAEPLGEVAAQVQRALQGGDLDAFGPLLAPDVRWGPADEPEWGCHDRQEVLAWYGAARDRGVRATVEEVLLGDGCLVVGLAVSGSPAAESTGGRTRRWQVLVVRDGLVADILGFDDRDRAVRRAGIAG